MTPGPPEWRQARQCCGSRKKACCGKLISPNPAKVVETRYEADKAADAPIPPDIREALRAALDVPDAPEARAGAAEASRPGTGDAEAGAGGAAKAGR